MFAKAMEDRLRANDHKGGWANELPQGLIERCREELGELDDAVDEIRANGPNAERLANVLIEAAGRRELRHDGRGRSPELARRR